MKSRLQYRLLGGLAVVGVALAAGTLASLWGAGRAKGLADRAVRLGEARALAGDALRASYELELAAVQYVRTADEAQAKAFDDALAGARVIMAKLDAATDHDLQKNRVSTALPILEDWAKTGGGAQIAARRSLKETRIGTLLDPAKGDKKLRDLRTLIVEYATQAEQEMAETRAQASAAFGLLNALLAGALALGLVADGAVGFHQIKTVVSPVRSVREWVQALRTGKAAALQIPEGDEIADLADSFKVMGGDLMAARREVESLLNHPDQSPHPVFQLKPSGEVAYSNPAAKKLAEKLGMTPPDLLPGDAAKVAEQLVGRDDGHARRERTFGDSRYDFLFGAGADLVFVVALERVRKLPAPAPAAAKAA